MKTTLEATLEEPITATIGELLTDFQPDTGCAAPAAAQQALVIARLLQRRASALQTAAEKKQQHELERMMQMPHDKATLMQMTDQSLRSGAPKRVVDQLTHILDVQGVPRFFAPFDRVMLKGFASFGGYLPGVAVPLVREKMRQETANVILPAEDEILGKHLRARQKSGLRMNVNILGEALLGEQAAAARLESYLATLRRPEVECLSVKISTIYSQISSLAWEDTVEVLCDRLERLYREAHQLRFTRHDGEVTTKFVYLDMEEYRDMSVTAAAFMRTLDRPGLADISAGIALQSYLPDAWAVQKKINEWARARVAAGGAPVTIRLVKGANLEMERVEASLHGWPQAPYKSKLEVDANYKRMLHEAMRGENLAAVKVGVASHNLFDVAYALVLAAQADAFEQVQFEMLEGMANHQRRALVELSQNLLLYAPASKRENFINAIGYLIRRLDENTGPDNFLSHAFKLEVGSEQWQELEKQFLDSFIAIDDLSAAPRRTQDRHAAPPSYVPDAPPVSDFCNEPDTDFSLAQNVAWAREIIDTWSARQGERAVEIPLCIAAEQISDERALAECEDPSRPGVVVGRYRQATNDDVLRAIRCAVDDPAQWRALDPVARCQILGNVAATLREARADLIGAAMADGGKTIPESDPEVSEAIDFVEYYRRSALAFQQSTSTPATPRGVVAVVSPWNFPIAIPCGGIAAALAAGNCVILKPASATVLVAYELCKCFWSAGVPREALQLAPCPGSGAGQLLVGHADVDVTILTGGTATARAILKTRPDLALLAETGGKNATIVTSMADREQAIRNILHSAFSHSGQKCSATSLLVLEDEIYEDEKFRSMLCDAVASLPVGPAWDTRTRIGPLIDRPGGALERGLSQLDGGEQWAVEPRCDPDNPRLYSPGLKWGVEPGSFTHMTELFGPVLGVMRARNLEHAVELVNQTGYGLTSGIETLDDRERAFWREHIEAGNLYINRVTTGAIVLRQPFGGFGKSAIGPGIKAGGPNYVAQLMNFSNASAPEGHAPTDPLLMELADALREHTANDPERATQVDQVMEAMASYAFNYKREFGREHDEFKLLGQHNLRRYLPLKELRIRVHPYDSFFDLIARIAAARTMGCRVTVSTPSMDTSADIQWLEHSTQHWGGGIEFVYESDEELAQIVRQGHTDRLRYAAPDRVSASVFEAAAQSGCYVAHAPVIADGRIELLWYCREQSISDSYHRYGNLGENGARGRADVL